MLAKRGWRRGRGRVVRISLTVAGGWLKIWSVGGQKRTLNPSARIWIQELLQEFMQNNPGILNPCLKGSWIYRDICSSLFFLILLEILTYRASQSVEDLDEEARTLSSYSTTIPPHLPFELHLG